MSTIYHVTTLRQWEDALRDGVYRGDTLDSEGFIHASTASQVDGVLTRFFKGKTGLVLLEIETERLTAPLKFEPATDAHELFPHLYGSLNVDAVASARPIAAVEGV